MLLIALSAYFGFGAFVGVVTTFISARDDSHEIHNEQALAQLPPDMYWLIVYLSSAAVSAIFWPVSFPAWIVNSIKRRP